MNTDIDGSPKILSCVLTYERGVFLRLSYFFALNFLFMAYLKKVRFDLTDFIMLGMSLGE